MIRQFHNLLVVLLAAAIVGCGGGGGAPNVELVWGRRGISDGDLQKPRAMAIDEDDRLYIVDMTARIQVFDRDGHFIRGWKTPAWENGRPTGLSFDREGNLLVADTHYFRMLVYTPEGTLLPERTIGGASGHRPGQFGLVTDAVQDSQGNYYIAEYGQYDRIQKFTRDGEYLFEWGGHGSEPGQFVRPQNLEIDENDHIWVADACNHRIQIFDATTGRPDGVRVWGTPGSQPGQLRYPYDLALAPDGTVYVCEWGNHRVQQFSRDGKSLAIWGTSGRGPGQFHNPWALVRDRQGRIHVLDTYNHRVQRVAM